MSRRTSTLLAMTLLGAAATFSSGALATGADPASISQCDGDGKKGSSATPQCDGDDHGKKKGSSATPQCDGDDHGKKKGSSATPQCDGDGKKGSSLY